MPKVVTPDQRKKAIDLYMEGWPANEAARKAGFSPRTMQRMLADMGLTRGSETTGGLDLSEPSDRGRPAQRRAKIPERALLRHELDPIAADCLVDFARFRYRYFGRISSPWQEHAANVCVEKLATMNKEYGVVNVAPGGGKSTTFTHDIPAWITARNRSIRGFIGSGSQSTATSYTVRLRNTFERPEPEEADEEDLRLGLAVHAQAALPVDYGRFRPFNMEDQASPPWRADAFTVLQHGETSTGDKETTWHAWGWNSYFIGWRVNFIIWDDLVDEESFSTVEQQIKMRSRWVKVAERRLEPGGLLILQGQRLGSEDLYRFCIDKETPDFDESVMDDLIDLGPEQLPMRKQYFHIIYPAHKEDICRAPTEGHKVHSKRANPYNPMLPDDHPDQGCLLDPVRISWQEQLSIQQDGITNYRTVYQQEDTNPAGVLVPEIWLYGGEDDEGFHPGCVDPTRTVCSPPPIPKGAKWYSYITVDPSPTAYWAIQWWVYVQASHDPPLMGKRYLMDMYRGRLTSPEFLDFNVGLNDYTGLVVDWYERAKALRFPVQFLIFEQNAAQRFVHQYPWFRQYLNARSIQLKAHATSKNKADPEYGVTTIRNHYKFGRVVIPGDPAGLRMAKPLIYEITHYPISDVELGTATDDTVMAQWFGEYNLPKFVPQDRSLPNIYQKFLPNFLGANR